MLDYLRKAFLRMHRAFRDPVLADGLSKSFSDYQTRIKKELLLLISHSSRLRNFLLQRDHNVLGRLREILLAITPSWLWIAELKSRPGAATTQARNSQMGRRTPQQHFESS
jgi:hypothetical protein